MNALLIKKRLSEIPVKELLQNGTGYSVRTGNLLRNA